MIETAVLAYIGLRRPYRFERAIVAALALVVATAVILAAGWLIAIGGLTSVGPRAYYFLYLLLLLALAVALVRWPALSAPVLTLAVSDFGLCVGSYALC